MRDGARDTCLLAHSLTYSNQGDAKSGRVPNPHPHPNPNPNQGDAKSGRIARADVAAIAIESIASAASFDTTFECYDGDTAKVSTLVS